MPVITLCPKLPYVPLTFALGSRAEHHSGTKLSELIPIPKVENKLFYFQLKLEAKEVVRERGLENIKLEELVSSNSLM